MKSKQIVRTYCKKKEVDNNPILKNYEAQYYQKCSEKH